ncbi:hypothetical protein BCR34DRAFT_233953 [Clohesyomyces aquaticus]|uniref:Uncharacterized protein n=1 Tax=Clohesyomyces aquaticus TaxID=1231657 RepID=A0A1Y1ZW44_9PLEO|nr:hypothetical protein BCR34DRAFT_233953 [Clohesyomyces aquaticus]
MHAWSPSLASSLRRGLRLQCDAQPGCESARSGVSSPQTKPSLQRAARQPPVVKMTNLQACNGARLVHSTKQLLFVLGHQCAECTWMPASRTSKCTEDGHRDTVTMQSRGASAALPRLKRAVSVPERRCAGDIWSQGRCGSGTVAGLADCRIRPSALTALAVLGTLAWEFSTASDINNQD